MEPGRSAAKLARSWKILQYKLSLALKQLRHFYGSKCSFAKIAIPYTIYLSLNLPEFYVWQLISMSMIDAPADDSGHSFAKIAIPYTIC